MKNLSNTILVALVLLQFNTIVFNNKKEIKITNKLPEVIIKDTIKESFDIPQTDFDVYLPLKKLIKTSDYGMRLHPISGKYKKHNGVDLASNDTVYSSLKCVIVEVNYNKTNGKYIVAKVGKSYLFYYLHLDKVFVLKGDTINAKHPIAKAGNTGLSSGNHLHFAIKKNNKFINPNFILNNGKKL